MARHQLHYQKDNLGIDIIPVLANLITQGLPTLLFRFANLSLNLLLCFLKKKMYGCPVADVED